MKKRRKRKLNREQVREASRAQDRKQNPRFGKGRKPSPDPGCRI